MIEVKTFRASFSTGTLAMAAVAGVRMIVSRIGMIAVIAAG
jgi:hypothetical protein